MLVSSADRLFYLQLSCSKLHQDQIVLPKLKVFFLILRSVKQGRSSARVELHSKKPGGFTHRATKQTCPTFTPLPALCGSLSLPPQAQKGSNPSRTPPKTDFSYKELIYTREMDIKLLSSQIPFFQVKMPLIKVDSCVPSTDPPLLPGLVLKFIPLSLTLIFHYYLGSLT